MNQFVLGLLIGIGAALVITPIGIFIVLFFNNLLTKRMIKTQLKKGNFLITIDPKDYDVSKWTNQKYGNIDQEQAAKDLKNLNLKIFKKDKSLEIEQQKAKIMQQLANYVILARKKGYTDERIRDELIKKNYTEELIKNIFKEVNK